MFYPGIGAHYIHNFLGSENWSEGYKESGIARRLNRKKLAYPLDLDSTSFEIKEQLIKLIQYKSSKRAFSPSSDFKINDIHPQCLSFTRGQGEDQIQVTFNLTNQKVMDLAPYELRFR